MVYAAKSQAFAGSERLVNLNAVSSSEDLLPLLEAYPDRTERDRVALAIYETVRKAHPLRNVGALAPLRRSEHLPLAKLKPLMAVRTPLEFRKQFLRSAALYFGGFYLVALVWTLERVPRRPRSCPRCIC